MHIATMAKALNNADWWSDSLDQRLTSQALRLPNHLNFRRVLRLNFQNLNSVVGLSPDSLTRPSRTLWP